MKPDRAIAALLFGIFLTTGFSIAAEGQSDDAWISALDEKQVIQTGKWGESRFRYAEKASLQTGEDEASVELDFEGTGIAIRLGGHNVPAYGRPNLGKLEIAVDEDEVIEIRPRETPREIVIAHGLKSGKHSLRVAHRIDNGNAGCRIEGFRVWSEPRGELRFVLNGEDNAFLVDARVWLGGDDFVRESLVRNWMTGQCSVTDIRPEKSYALEIRAKGWKPFIIEEFEIKAGSPTILPAIYLQREESTIIKSFRFPALNRPAIRKPGETFRARFLAYQTAIEEVVLTRKVGQATISRKLDFEEDEEKAYYYDREVVAKLPDDMPPGLYDLSVQINGGRRTGFCKSPRSVHVVREFPKDPVFVTFGHLDTSGQYQAEYLGRIAEMANLIGADFVLNSNAVNPAYISGALSKLEVPYVVNFGNHQFFGHEKWYGDPVNRIDFGPNISILNYGHPWHHGIELADGLFAERAEADIKIINAFEQNAPLEFLDRHQVKMIHDAHGTGERVMDMGKTPTRRIGKTNAISFRVVRFKDGRVETCTYDGHETKPIPFERDEEPPLSFDYSDWNNIGDKTTISATITNRYLDPFPNGRVVFLMPKGEYQATNGRIESQIESDDGRYVVVAVRADIPAEGEIEVSLGPK